MEFAHVLDLLRTGVRLRTHSGQVRPGDVFLALPGSRGDGGRYVADAVANGARVIVHGPGLPVAQTHGVAYVAVDNPTQALGRLARAAFGTEERMPRIVGVTGTNGKTTTAYLVYDLLVHNGFCPGLIGTVSCQWPGVEVEATMTTPDGLALHELIGRMQHDGVDALVMEISSHALDQERIAGVPIDIGVFSNLTQDHLDYHGTMSRYFAAKARLFTDPALACGQGAVNVDDQYGRNLRDMRGDLLGFGLDSPDALLQGRIKASGAWGMVLAMSHEGRQWELQTSLMGRYNASNLLAAQAVGLLLDLEPNQMHCLQESIGAPGRLQRVPNSRELHIFVDYAHTPDALDKVSAALKAMGFARLITVFGCGGDRDAGKRPLMGQAAARHADVVVLTSDNPRTEDPEAILDQVEPGLKQARRVEREVDRRKAIGLAIALMQPGDALLIAGKGHENYQIIGRQKSHFSDFEVVREFVA